MNTANEKNANATGSEIELLLPWHAAGTLSRGEAQRVDAALAGDPELARRYELVREELGETIHLNETLGAPSARAMEALFAKIAAEPVRRPVPSLNLGARLREFFANLSPRTLAWSATAAALAIVLQAGVITGVLLRQGSPAAYLTASAPSAPRSAEGSFALIRFQSQASAAEIASFLAGNHLSIVDGPSLGGFYRVRLADNRLPGADLTGLVKKLRQDKIVGFIGSAE